MLLPLIFTNFLPGIEVISSCSLLLTSALLLYVTFTYHMRPVSLFQKVTTLRPSNIINWAMVTLGLLFMVDFLTISDWFFVKSVKSLKSVVILVAIETNMKATMWKGIKICMRNWCPNWPCISFEAIYRENKQCSVCNAGQMNMRFCLKCNV